MPAPASAVPPCRCVTSDRVSASDNHGRCLSEPGGCAAQTQTTLLTAQSGQGDVVLRAVPASTSRGQCTVGHVDITAAGALMADVIEGPGRRSRPQAPGREPGPGGRPQGWTRCAAAVPYGRLAGEGPAGGRPGHRAAHGRRMQDQDESAARDVLPGRRWPAAKAIGRPAGRTLRWPVHLVTVREWVSGADMRPCVRSR